MRHASLFSGIGAPELAAHWLDWENAFHWVLRHFWGSSCVKASKFIA